MLVRVLLSPELPLIQPRWREAGCPSVQGRGVGALRMLFTNTTVGATCFHLVGIKVLAVSPTLPLKVLRYLLSFRVSPSAFAGVEGLGPGFSVGWLQ